MSDTLAAELLKYIKNRTNIKNLTFEPHGELGELTRITINVNIQGYGKVLVFGAEAMQSSDTGQVVGWTHRWLVDGPWIEDVNKIIEAFKLRNERAKRLAELERIETERKRQELLQNLRKEYTSIDDDYLTMLATPGTARG